MGFDIVSALKMIIIGVVQGITEPIPVSSSGHVIIFSELLGVGEQGFTFAILTNTASLFAVLIIYRKDIINLISGFLGYTLKKNKEKKSEFNFSIFIIIASIPAGVLGLLLSDRVSDSVSVNVIAITLIITGIALILIKNLNGKKEDKDIKLKDSIIVGLGQAIALIPGISRSGSTVITAIACGLNRKTALKFSFMLYIPVSFGGLILGLSDFINNKPSSDMYLPYILCFVVTFITTYFSMKMFMGIMDKGKIHYFSYYCFLVSILILTFM